MAMVRAFLSRAVPVAGWLLLACSCSAGDGAVAEADTNPPVDVRDEGVAPDVASIDVAPLDEVADLDPDELVGAFQITLYDTYTWVIGLVNDGPSPSLIVWDEDRTDGPCTLYKPRSPFCEACPGADACVEDGVCLAYPTPVSVGLVSVSGVHTVDGAEGFEMKPLAGNYQPSGVDLAFPGFAEGDVLEVEAAGAGAVPGFALQAVGIAPLAVTTASFVLTDGQALPVAWAPAGSTGASRVLVSLEIAHHGGYKGRVDCDVDDSGALVIPATLVDELKALGVAGFPTISLLRWTSDSVTLPLGRVDLVVSTEAVRAVEIPGLVSCTDDTDCPDGQTCRDDLSCR